MNITGLFSYGILTIQHSLVHTQFFAGSPPVVSSEYIAAQKDPGYNRSCSALTASRLNFLPSAAGLNLKRFQ